MRPYTPSSSRCCASLAPSACLGNGPQRVWPQTLGMSVGAISVLVPRLTRLATNKAFHFFGVSFSWCYLGLQASERAVDSGAEFPPAHTGRNRRIGSVWSTAYACGREVKHPRVGGPLGTQPFGLLVLIAVGNSPYAVAFSPTLDLAYVANNGDNKPTFTFPSTAGSYTLLFDDDGSATPGHVLA